MAAIRLARAGASVTLFDPSHPREKPCGGGLTGRALGLVADVLDMAALPAVVATSATVEAPGSAGLGRPTTAGDAASAQVDLIDCGLSPHSSLLVLSRALFDRALVDAAIKSGATLIPEKAVAISREGRSMAIRTAHREHLADFLLGADGANSLVRKAFARPFAREEVSVAAGYFVHGVRSSAIVVRSMSKQPGYLWSFPRPDHLAVGICAPASGRASSVELGSQCLEWIESHDLRDGARLERYAWPIPSVGHSDPDQVRAAGPGWMLLGDAAGLVDPLTREGLYYALLSGVWAAEALADSARLPQAYEERLRTEVYPELSRAARLSRTFFSPAFSNLFVAALRESGPIRRVFADLVGGAQPYRGLRRRLLRTHEWKLAGRAVRLVVQ